MPNVIRNRFPMHRHARASAGFDSEGYKSGRRSYRETPDARSTASTRSGGTSSHCEIACAEIPSGAANAAKPPAASIARFRASLLSLMAKNSSIALPQSQAMLHCFHKVTLYNVEMTLGNRIKMARERLVPKPTQEDIAAVFNISDKAVSAWERDDAVPEPAKIPELRRILRVTYIWLFEGTDAPPSPDDPEVLIEDLASAERAAVMTLMESFLNKRGRVA